MKQLAGYELLFFDMDGTILSSDKVSLDAIQEAYRDVYAKNGIQLDPPPREDICAQIGKPDKTFFLDILPKELYHLQPELRHKSTEYEMKYYNEGRGGLFEGSAETLDKLNSRGYKLALISNCGKEYFDAVSETFGLNKFFDRRICIGETDFVIKADLVEKVYREYGEQDFVMIGDREYDLHAAKRFDMPSVACLYGFGSAQELSGGTKKINDIRGLSDLFTGK